MGEEWVNSRGVIFRFDRKAVEIRVMDEQECIKSDVALSCFIRALLRGLMKKEPQLLPHEVLIRDYRSIIELGLEANVEHPHGHIARQVCEYYLNVARKNATDEEKPYLALIQTRVKNGNLSEIIRRRIKNKAQKTDIKEAIACVYSKLTRSLMDNQPYF